MDQPQDGMIGESEALALALDRISQVAPINRPVLILGERGTGKELAAQRLHFLSKRWDGPLIKINCAAMADSLLESELFGHEPGAFTGANRLHKGRFERGDGGTIFLDELATMSIRLQEKLLRLLEYGEFERLGGQQTLKVDIRVVAATNGDLLKLAAEQQFREDLLDRLSFDVIHLPALRDRPDDIPQLAQHFALQMCRELEWDAFPGFTKMAMQALTAHVWPGNVRELKNTVERSLYRWAKPSKAVNAIIIDPFASPYSAIETKKTASQRGALADAASNQNQTDSDSSDGGDSSLDGLLPRFTKTQTTVSGVDFKNIVAEFESTLLQRALQENLYNQRATAEALSLSYDQLRGLVKKYQLGGEAIKTDNSAQEVAS